MKWPVKSKRMSLCRISQSAVLAACVIVLSSCNIIRGYRADGLHFYNTPPLVNIDSPKHYVGHAFGGITCTVKDLAKIGRLYLNKGVWDGKRIVSEE